MHPILKVKLYSSQCGYEVFRNFLLTYDYKIILSIASEATSCTFHARSYCEPFSTPLRLPNVIQ